MARNDTILVDGIIDQRVSEGVPSTNRSEVFEYLVFEQALKNYDLDREELESGWVDGGDDGGIDGAFLFINGHLVNEIGTFQWPRSNAHVEVYLFTCKHHDTFREAPLNTMFATLSELFDLSVDDGKLKGKYSPAIIAFRRKFTESYKRVAIRNPQVIFRCLYGSRGDSAEVGASVLARSKQIKCIFSNLFSKSSTEFTFLGSKEIVEKFRVSKQFSLDLSFVDHLSGVGEGYILVVKIGDYYRFIADEDGKLRRYLFDSNVRDFLGYNKVNDDIAESLRDESIPDFWWLNNGITVLATRAVINGKRIILQDIQVVNGLQTTETIYDHFKSGNISSGERTLAVKVVVSSDDSLRDKIIVATNNQSAVEQSALRATDRIQRDIEQILEKNDWYYERRRNYYRNIGRPAERFVTPLFLAGAFMALGRKDPAGAARLKSRFMRSERSYRSVFSEDFPIGIWPNLVVVTKAAEAVMLATQREMGPQGERFLRSWRGLVALLYMSRKFGTFDFSLGQLSHFSFDESLDDEIRDCWAFVQGLRRGAIRPSSRTCIAICKTFSAENSISGSGCIGQRALFGDYAEVTQNVSDDFVEQVFMLLPTQPWAHGVHIEIANKLDSTGRKVTAAIHKLIESGRCYDQRHGILYDSNGNIVSSAQVGPTQTD